MSSSYRTLLLLAVVAGAAVDGRRLPPVYWNSSNPIFDISNTDHVMQVEIGDQVSIVCPEPGDDYEYTKLFLVNEEEYQHCALEVDKAKLIGACQDAASPSTISIVFRKYSPLPGGLEFQPGNTYYVISTSTGTLDGLESRKAGLCATAQMKVKFEVEPDRHHHKATRHETDRGVAVSPKFAARVTDRASVSPPSSSSPSSDSARPIEYSTDGQQFAYEIHDRSETEEKDDDSSSGLSLLPTILLLSIGYLLRRQ